MIKRIEEKQALIDGITNSHLFDFLVSLKDQISKQTLFLYYGSPFMSSVLFLFSIILCVYGTKYSLITKKEGNNSKKRKYFNIKKISTFIFLVSWITISSFSICHFLQNHSPFESCNFLQKLEFLRFNILSTVLFLIFIFLLILILPRLGMFLLTFGSCTAGFAIFIRSPSTPTFLLAVFTIFLAFGCILLSRDLFTGFIINLERGILTIGKNFVSLFIFFFFTSCLYILALLSLKTLFYFKRSDNPASLKHLFFIFLISWTFNAISYFNTVFVSSLVYRRLSKQNSEFFFSLKVAFFSLNNIYYASLLPAFFDSSQFLIETAKTILNGYQGNFIGRILLLTLRGISFLLGIFTYLLNSYNEIIFSYIGMYTRLNKEPMEPQSYQRNVNVRDSIRKNVNVRDSIRNNHKRNIRGNSIGKAESHIHQETDIKSVKSIDLSEISTSEETNIKTNYIDSTLKYNKKSMNYSPLLTSKEFILFRGLKYKNWILKLTGILYLSFFFFINFKSIPCIILPNSSLATFSFETFEMLFEFYFDFAIVLLLCLNIVNSFVSAIEPAFIASYCFRKNRKRTTELKVEQISKNEGVADAKMQSLEINTLNTLKELIESEEIFIEKGI